MLAAAADRLGGSIDIKRLIRTYTEKGDCRVSCVMEAVFHADGGEDENEVEDGKGKWCEIGDETNEERE